MGQCSHCRREPEEERVSMPEPAWLDRSEYPFAPHYLNVGAGRMHYVDEGSGSPVLMVHGNPTWSFLYRHLIKQLRPRHRCVAPDHLGFGLSDKPSEWTYLPEDHARNLAALVEALGLKGITLVVHDWGGPIGLSYALENPENVERIIVMNSWAWPVNRDPYYIAFSSFMGGPLGRFLIRRYNFFARVIMRKAFGNPTKLTEHVHQHYLRPLDRPEDRRGCAVFPKQILGSTAWLRSLWERNDQLNAKPKLIVWGMRDIAFREQELRRWKSAFPDARVVRLGTVGHFVQEEAPEELREAVEQFLAKPDVL